MCFIAGLCKVSFSKTLLFQLFLLNAKVWNSYSSCLMKPFTTTRIFTLDGSPGADSSYPFSAVHIPRYSCWKEVKHYQKCTGIRKAVCIVTFPPAIIVEFRYYNGGTGCILREGKNMGKKDWGDNKETVNDILKQKTRKRSKSGIQGKVVMKVSKSSGTYGWSKKEDEKTIAFWELHEVLSWKSNTYG